MYRCNTKYVCVVLTSPIIRVFMIKLTFELLRLTWRKNVLVKVTIQDSMFDRTSSIGMNYPALLHTAQWCSKVSNRWYFSSLQENINHAIEKGRRFPNLVNQLLELIGTSGIDLFVFPKYTCCTFISSGYKGFWSSGSWAPLTKIMLTGLMLPSSLD